jgi:hypothetical protein
MAKGNETAIIFCLTKAHPAFELTLPTLTSLLPHPPPGRQADMHMGPPRVNMAQSCLSGPQTGCRPGPDNT